METHRIVSFSNINESLMIILNPAILKVFSDLECNNFELRKALFTIVFSEYLPFIY